MNTPHKYAAVIKAWADGAQIQISYPQSGQPEIVWSEWEDVPEPKWHEGSRYRVKPHKNQHVIDAWAAGKVVQYRLCKDHSWVTWDPAKSPNAKLRFDLDEWRIKPECVEQYLKIDQWSLRWMDGRSQSESNLKLVFEDGKLIDAKVL